MAQVLLVTHPAYLEHVPGRRHPERPARLQAVLAGLAAAGLDDALVPTTPRPATRAELERVHPAHYLDWLRELCLAGGGVLDIDTRAGPASWDAAVLAAGAGPSAVERLAGGEGDAAFLAVRPPGHHASADLPKGFCLLNNVAVTAASLAAAGERVLIVDFDAHHGDGTQDTFYDDGRVAYVSMHQYGTRSGVPFYPGTGRVEETGHGAGAGLTVNFPFPPHTTGDAYLEALDDVVVPLAEAFGPTWVLASAGFDAHAADPRTDLGLSSGDFAAITSRVMELAPKGKRLAFLEGGYDLDALALSAAACVGAMAGVAVAAEPSTSGGPGRRVVAAARAVRAPS